VGEVGWPSGPDAEEWNKVASAWFDRADAAHLWVTVWAAGRWWPASYRMAVYRLSGRPGVPPSSGPQAAVAAAHFAVPGALRGVALPSGSFGAGPDGPSSYSNSRPGRPDREYYYENGDDYRSLADRGVQVVRLSFTWERVQRSLDGPLDAAEIARLRTSVAAAHRAGLAVILDVTDAGHITALSDALPDRLDAIVNNAGISVGGPMETVGSDEWRKQLEINVIGQLAVTRAVLPRLRKTRGRIVFISSVNGKLSMPMLGAYAASKFALEAAADAMRMELRPWHIPVIVVEPSQTDTDMWRKADVQLEEALASVSQEHQELYAQHIDGMRRAIPRSQRMAASADGVADTIFRALTERRPRPRYIVGAAPRAQFTMARLLPTRVLDSAIRRQSGITTRS